VTVLRLRLASPLQSWGAPSRFTQRATEAAPTKSGILGLLSAAQGRRRSDPLEDLLDLELAVRVEQQGTLLRDFHTAHGQPLTNRYYWSDAVFTAHIGGRHEVLEGVAEAVDAPKFPLYFGRRSCVPVGRVVLDIVDETVAESLQALPWQAGRSGRHRMRRQPTVRLNVQADASVYPGAAATRELADLPMSFDPVHRQYRTRVVVDTTVELPTNSPGVVSGGPAHDPMAALGDAS
jgi:CRISPR system Cascade subunit CasD